MNGYMNSITILLNDSISITTPVINVINNYCKENEMNIIMKSFLIQYQQQPIIDIKDLFIIFNFSESTIHCNSTIISLSLSYQAIQQCIQTLHDYQDFLSLLMKDIQSISKSIEDSEVITKDAIYLRRSIDRSNSTDSHGIRKRHSSLSTIPSDSQEGDGFYKRFISQFRFTYTIDRVTFQYDSLYQFEGTQFLFYLGDNTVQMNLNSISFYENQQSTNLPLLISYDQAFSLVLSSEESTSLIIALNNYKVNLSFSSIQLLLHTVTSLSSLLPSSSSSSSVESEVQEPNRFIISLSCSQSELCYMIHDHSFYQCKLIQFQCQYDQYPTNSKEISLLLSNFFLADSSNRLLLTDFSGQIDIALNKYPGDSTVYIQCGSNLIDCSIDEKDIEEFCCIIQDIQSLQLSSQSSSSESLSQSSPSHPLSPPSSLALSIRVSIPAIQFILSNSTSLLKASLTSVQIDYQPNQVHSKDRLFSIDRITVDLNEELMCSLSVFDSTACLAIEREQRDGVCWYSCFLGDCYLFIPPEFISLLDSTLIKPFSKLSFSSSSSSSSTIPDKQILPLEDRPKTGLSIITQSIQTRIGLSHSFSFLFACSSLSLLQSHTVCHMTLSQCCILYDQESPQPLSSLYNENQTPKQHILLNQCTVVFNIDSSSRLDYSTNSLLITRTITLDVQDIIASLDNQIIQSLSYLYDSFLPPLQSLLSSSSQEQPSPCLSSSEDEIPISSNSSLLSEDPYIQPENIPLEFSLLHLKDVIQDAWPKENELVIIPTVLSKEMEEGDKAVHLHYPSLDYYSIVNGSIPLVTTTEDYHTQTYSALSKQSSSSPYLVKMQFRFPQVIRLFSICIEHLSKEKIDSICGTGFASVIGSIFEFDLMAWSEIKRSFDCIKSVFIPVGKLQTKKDEDIPDLLQETMKVTETDVEYYEMEPPYSYSDRYEICVYLHSYHPGEMSFVGGMLGVIKGVAALVKHVITLQYYTSPILNHFTSVNITSNMILLNLNHIACSEPKTSACEAIQFSITKPKLLYRLSKDCQEIILNGTFSINTMNLTHLLIMPVLQKFNFYASFVSISFSIIYRCSYLQANEYFLPTCLSSTILTSDIDFILNLDSILLIEHLIDCYYSAWNYHQQQQQHQTSIVCSNHRILFYNNSTMNLFISQLFTDECVYLPKYVFSYCFSIETLLFLIHTNILLFFNNKLLFYDLQLLLSNSLIFSFIYLVSQQKNLVLGLKVLIFTPSHVKKKNVLNCT